MTSFDALDEELIEARSAAISDSLAKGRDVPITKASPELIDRFIQRTNLEQQQEAVIRSHDKIEAAHGEAVETVARIEEKIDELVARLIVEEATDVAADLVEAEDKAYALRLRLNAIGALRRSDNHFFALPEPARELLRDGPIFANKWDGLSPRETAYWRSRIARLRSNVDEA